MTSRDPFQGETREAMHSTGLARLKEIVEVLRGPDGCPWDRKQTAATFAPYLLEESFEAVQAITDRDSSALREELGDVLLNVFMQIQIAEEAGEFTLEEVAGDICEKMIRRHPHVFGREAATSPEDVKDIWAAVKRAETLESTAASGPDPRPSHFDRSSALKKLPPGFPALLRSQRLGQDAARVGFDWPDVTGPLEKIREETAEVEEALLGESPSRVAEELGDLLFAVVNLARKTEVDAEMSLRAACDRFSERFRDMEAELGDLNRYSLEELEAAWVRAKQRKMRPE